MKGLRGRESLSAEIIVTVMRMVRYPVEFRDCAFSGAVSFFGDEQTINSSNTSFGKERRKNGTKRTSKPKKTLVESPPAALTMINLRRQTGFNTEGLKFVVAVPLEY